ncbi:hypothetical protein [Malikia spinosa]|uniref:hypothetical protein n=1 Tax=Malikia spinosa TaxID=86180 RepID=UPI002FD8D421
MNNFDNKEIVATGCRGQEIRIPYENVRGVQEYFGLDSINAGGISIAGSIGVHVRICTFDGGVFYIPRVPDNDSAVLTFLFRKSRNTI